MAFNINDFITNMTYDGARPNLFEIIFSSPGGGIIAPDVRFRAKASALPASTVGVASTYYFGRQAKFAGNRVFGDWTVTIVMDETDFNAGARLFLENWSNQINGHISNIRNNQYVPPRTYMMDGDIIQYQKDGVELTKYRMIGCFPTDVGAIPVDWEANDRIMEFQVTFAMQWWERTLATDIGGSL